MTLPALVLVHGGGMTVDSWELTVEEIHRLAPELTVLTLDMPGRRGKPGDLREGDRASPFLHYGPQMRTGRPIFTA